MAVGATTLALAASLALAVQVGENGALRDQLGEARGQLTAVATELETAEAWIERAVATGADAFFMSGEGQGAEGFGWSTLVVDMIDEMAPDRLAAVMPRRRAATRPAAPPAPVENSTAPA